jgi:hypothetical protein
MGLNLVGFNTCLGQDGTRMAREVFFTTTSYGDLAWLPSATTTDKETAQAQRFVRDLSDGTCFTLPTRDRYWFLLNHRSIEDANQSGFFAVEIVGESSEPGGTYLSLVRNEDWISYDGKDLPDEAYGQSPQLKMSIDRFVDVHDDTKSAALSDEQRQSVINDAMNDIWHARLDKNKSGTWAYRYVFSKRSHLVTQGDKSNQVSARLMQFYVTGKQTSTRPVIFLVRRNGASVFWINVAGPSLPLSHETEFRIGTSCSQ